HCFADFADKCSENTASVYDYPRKSSALAARRRRITARVPIDTTSHPRPLQCLSILISPHCGNFRQAPGSCSLSTRSVCVAVGDLLDTLVVTRAERVTPVSRSANNRAAEHTPKCRELSGVLRRTKRNW